MFNWVLNMHLNFEQISHIDPLLFPFLTSKSKCWLGYLKILISLFNHFLNIYKIVQNSYTNRQTCMGSHLLNLAAFTCSCSWKPWIFFGLKLPSNSFMIKTCEDNFLQIRNAITWSHQLVFITLYKFYFLYFCWVHSSLKIKCSVKTFSL